MEHSRVTQLKGWSGASGGGSDQWTVQPAGAIDAPHLARLRWEFRCEVAGNEGVVEEAARFLIRCSDWMTARLAEPGSWRAWCGWEGGNPVGTAWAQMIEKIPNPVDEMELLGYVSSVYVKPGHRGRGLGRALTAAAVDWCRRSGAAEVILWPTPASRSMYSQSEFQAAGDIFRRVFLSNPQPLVEQQHSPPSGQVVKTTSLS